MASFPGTSTERQQTGTKAEDDALAFLQGQGLTPVTRNFRCRFGEIDLIMQEGNTLVFVEVKTRKDCAARFDDYGLPCEAVNTEKQRHILYTARIFLEKHPTDKYIRFDVVEIYRSEDGKSTRVNHIESAFEAR